jgi:hypothetical protein
MYAKPHQKVEVVRYSREFVITVIVITEFDYTIFIFYSLLFVYNHHYHKLVVVVIEWLVLKNTSMKRFITSLRWENYKKNYYKYLLYY